MKDVDCGTPAGAFVGKRHPGPWVGKPGGRQLLPTKVVWLTALPENQPRMAHCVLSTMM